MALNGNETRSGRETRLLVLVVGVAIAVLLLLARYRFPGSDISVVSPSAAPLAGLAARATFDEMANTMADVLGKVSPSVIVVRMAPVETAPERDAARGRKPAPASRGEGAAETPPPPRPTFTLAVRVRPDMALVHIPAGMALQNSPDMTINIVSHDTAREMALLRVAASAAAPETLASSLRTLPGFAYVAAVGATRVGPTIHPVFIGRTESVNDPRWSHPLVPAAAGPGLTPGTLVFSINSRLVGLVVRTNEGPMIVPAPALETLVLALEAGGPAQ